MSPSSYNRRQFCWSQPQQICKIVVSHVLPVGFFSLDYTLLPVAIHSSRIHFKGPYGSFRSLFAMEKFGHSAQKKDTAATRLVAVSPQNENQCFWEPFARLTFIYNDDI